MYPKLVVSDYKNRIFDVEGVAAAGMKAGSFYPLPADELIKLPYASELFVLKDRAAVGFSASDGKPMLVTSFCHSEGATKWRPKNLSKILRPHFVRPQNDKISERCYPVAAFISPGYTVTYSAAYVEKVGARRAVPLLPLFSYAAVCWYKGGFYTTAVRVERERRQDLRLMDMALMRRNIKRFIRLFPKNRLVKHLSSCAASYGCPAATNFFLQRYECPLPASPSCNSACVGCISVKHSATCPAVQPRIRFVPAAEEITEVALHHIRAVKQPVVSFGQGCEGEPLLVAGILEAATKLIRKETKKGIINLNTNASRPQMIKRLRHAGLDSMRVSLNSVRERFYNLYYKPRGYNFKDVLLSIKIVKESGGFVSVNYLVMPGFTDQREEAESFFDFIGKTKIDMIQWRNLNYDPVDYFRKMKINVGANGRSPLHVGVRQLIEETKRRFPDLRHGYFNPFFRITEEIASPRLRRGSQ